MCETNWVWENKNTAFEYFKRFAFKTEARRGWGREREREKNAERVRVGMWMYQNVIESANSNFLLTKRTGGSYGGGGGGYARVA